MKAMLLITGGEENEAAIKLAKACTGKVEVIDSSMSFHLI